LGTVQRTLEFDIYESEGFNSTLHPLDWLPDDSLRPNIRSGFVEWTIQSDIDRSELTAVCNLRDICGDKGNQNGIVPRCSAIPWNNRSVDSSDHTRFSYQAIGFEILFPFLQPAPVGFSRLTTVARLIGKPASKSDRLSALGKNVRARKSIPGPHNHSRGSR